MFDSCLLNKVVPQKTVKKSTAKSWIRKVDIHVDIENADRVEENMEIEMNEKRLDDFRPYHNGQVEDFAGNSH